MLLWLVWKLWEGQVVLFKCPQQGRWVSILGDGEELDSDLLTFLSGSRRLREPPRLVTAVRFLKHC